MPDRIVRDELLTSERYWLVSMQAQQLYVHLLLVVDDAARFSGKNFTLRAACFPGRQIEAHHMEKMLHELMDVDLIRMYEVGGERFVFMPRFRNRRRYVSSSCYPAPPNEINDLPALKSSLSQPQVIPESAPSQEGRGRRGVGVGEKKEILVVPLDRPTKTSPPKPRRKTTQAEHPLFDAFYAAYPRKVARTAAEASFAKIDPDEKLLERMLQAIATGEATNKSDREFIPHPATWLNNKRWLDNPQVPTGAVRGSNGKVAL